MDSTEIPLQTGYTLTLDWLAFTVPSTTTDEIQEVIGNEWTTIEYGFRGYPKCWITSNGAEGVGKLGAGAPRRPNEFHADLSAGIVASWPFEKIKTVLRWVIAEQKGHITRLDCALDDRKPLVPVSIVKEAYKTGKAVTRARRFKLVSAEDAANGASLGETLYFGSRMSHTLLRVYDKRLELRQKGRENWEEFGTRWELELKKEQAHRMATHLVSLEESEWLAAIISRLRSYIDFRDTTRDGEESARCRAPLLDWWSELTEGLAKGRFTVQKPDRRIEDVKDWFSRALGPTFAVLCVSPETGRAYFEQVIQSGADRWKEKHRQLLKRPKPKRSYVLKT